MRRRWARSCADLRVNQAEAEEARIAQAGFFKSGFARFHPARVQAAWSHPRGATRGPKHQRCSSVAWLRGCTAAPRRHTCSATRSEQLRQLPAWQEQKCQGFEAVGLYPHAQAPSRAGRGRAPCQLCPAPSRPVTSPGLESAPHDVVLSAALLLPDPSSSSPFPTASPQRWHSKKAEPWDAPEVPGGLRHTTEPLPAVPRACCRGLSGVRASPCGAGSGAEGTGCVALAVPQFPLFPPWLYLAPGVEPCSVGFGGAAAHFWHWAPKSLVASALRARPRGGAGGTAVIGGRPFGPCLLWGRRGGTVHPAAVVRASPPCEPGTAAGTEGSCGSNLGRWGRGAARGSGRGARHTRHSSGHSSGHRRVPPWCRRSAAGCRRGRGCSQHPWGRLRPL